MAKKLLLGLLALLLVIGTVTAGAYSNFSIRGRGGAITYLGDESEFDSARVQFSANGRVAEDIHGRASVRIRATVDGKLRILNLNLKATEIKQYDANRIYIDNTAKGIYYKHGGRAVRLEFDSLRYDDNINTGLVNIAGETADGFSFRVTGAEVLIR